MAALLQSVAPQKSTNASGDKVGNLTDFLKNVFSYAYWFYTDIEDEQKKDIVETALKYGKLITSKQKNIITITDILKRDPDDEAAAYFMIILMYFSEDQINFILQTSLILKIKKLLICRKLLILFSFVWIHFL